MATLLLSLIFLIIGIIAEAIHASDQAPWIKVAFVIFESIFACQFFIGLTIDLYITRKAFVYYKHILAAHPGGIDKLQILKVTGAG